MHNDSLDRTAIVHILHRIATDRGLRIRRSLPDVKFFLKSL